jgi:hypothetical protein
MTYSPFNTGDFPTGTFYPYVCDVTNVTNTNPILVTTAVDHMFVIGNQVQFQMPPQWGMRQLNFRKGYVIGVPASNQVTVTIDALQFDPFITPSVSPPVVIDNPQIIPVGDQNSGSSSPGGIPMNPNIIPGGYFVTEEVA